MLVLRTTAFLKDQLTQITFAKHSLCAGNLV